MCQFEQNLHFYWSIHFLTVIKYHLLVRCTILICLPCSHHCLNLVLCRVIAYVKFQYIHATYWSAAVSVVLRVLHNVKLVFTNVEILLLICLLIVHVESGLLCAAVLSRNYVLTHWAQYFFIFELECMQKLFTIALHWNFATARA